MTVPGKVYLISNLFNSLEEIDGSNTPIMRLHTTRGAPSIRRFFCTHTDSDVAVPSAVLSMRLRRSAGNHALATLAERGALRRGVGPRIAAVIKSPYHCPSLHASRARVAAQVREPPE